VNAPTDTAARARTQARKLENSRLLREDVAAGATSFRGLPEVIALHTTEICNLACVMCPRSLGQGKLKLSRERLAALFDDLFPTARKVALSGAAGEPLLSDFDLVLDHARAHDVRIDVVTNGTELTPDLYREAAPLFDHVNVSIDSSLPEVYERVRVHGSFERLDRNLRAIAELRRARPDGVLFSLSSVVMRSTLPHLEQLLEYTKSLGFDGVILQRLDQGALRVRSEDPQLAPGPAATAAALERLDAAAERIGVNLFAVNVGRPNRIVSAPREKVPPELLSPRLCSYLAHHFGVQPTGEVYACCYPTDYRLGDLHHESPRAIWNGELAQRLRAAHFARRAPLFCAGCVHAPHLAAPRARWLHAGLLRARVALARWKNRRREPGRAAAAR
jgi:radical SAM protein with 4Fe4S-binding SPASM domain